MNVMTVHTPTRTATAQRCYRVAVVQWTDSDGIAAAITATLQELGHRPLPFKWDASIPPDADLVFSFAPYGNFMAIVRQLERIPARRRPPLIHWNTEGIPDLRLPWWSVRMASSARSQLGRTVTATADWLPRKITAALHKWNNSHMLRFRYVGDYYYAYQQGCLTLFADSSQVYARIHRQHQLPTHYFPWGAVPAWYADLGLPRDIDVLWMGKRGSKRRSDLLDRVRRELRPHGVEIYVADNQENPYIFDHERTAFLNRAKITLNITRTWYDDNFSRFSMAAPNRSLIISEPMLPHCPEFEAGVHYVSAPIERLAETIVYYLKHEDQRATIVENAHELVMTRLTMRNSVQNAIDAVDQVRCTLPHSSLPG
jgi:hypothetical protein